jgi:2-hydroxy-6-oxonona-2,4-dienedioate hydrolase
VGVFFGDSQLVRVTAVQTQAQRIEQPYAWGAAVWHVWGARGDDFVGCETDHPLVLLHGGSGSWTHWVRNVEHIAQYRPVWALDLPGFGDSTLPDGVSDADDLVPFIADILMHTFKGKAVDVMGFSFGGMAAGLVAAQHPGLIRELVLVGVPGLGLFGRSLPMRGMQPNMDEAAQRAVHRHNLSAMMLTHADSVTEEVIDLQQANVARDRMRRRRIARTDVLAHVQARWACPVHGVWGCEDALYKDTLMQVPNVLYRLKSFTVVPDAGHWVMFEQSDAFHAVVDPILNRRNKLT